MSYTEQERLEAAEWFIDIHDVDDPSSELLHDWMRWMEASASHRLAFSAVERAWRGAADSLPPAESGPGVSDEQDDDYDGRESVHSWRTRRLRQAGPPSPRPRGRNRRHAWFAAAGAAVVCASAILLAPVSWWSLGASPEPSSFTTRTGEQLQVTLPDGSQVSLGPRSTLNLAFTADARDLRLAAGEAFFSVRRDPSRPFRVHVFGGVVTAVGTQFDVRTANDRVVVAVAEGAVQVNGAAAAANAAQSSLSATTSDPGAAVTRLRRGEVISFVSRRGDPTLQSATVTRVDPSDPARWREGWLVYRDEPLRDVLADISRYTDRTIIVAQSVSLNQHFSGAVFRESIPEWLESLPNAFAVTLTIDGPRVTIAPASKAALLRQPL